MELYKVYRIQVVTALGVIGRFNVAAPNREAVRKAGEEWARKTTPLEARIDIVRRSKNGEPLTIFVAA